MEGKEHDWNKWRERLEEKEFVKLEQDGVLVEEVYLEYIVKRETEETELQILKVMSGVFSDIPEAIFLLGNKAYEFGTVELEKAELMKIAIEAYEKALKVYTEREFPEIFTLVGVNLKSVRDFCEGD